MTRQRIILHAGFHKTGTTTVQSCLHLNGPHIWPTTALGLSWRFKPLLHAARGFSTWRDPLTLEKFAMRFATFLAELDLPPDRKLVISAEELAGHMPGRRDVPDYGALPALMTRAIEVMEAQYQHGLDLTFYLSTRAADAWLQSAWAEHVKASRMVLERDEFCARNAAAADLTAVAASLARAVAPYEVVTHALEDSRTLPLGPAEPLINLIGLPADARAALTPAPNQNTRLPDHALQQMLTLNRTDMDREALNAAKAQVIAALGGA